MRLNALQPVSGGVTSSLVDFGKQLLQSVTQAYIAKRTGQVPAPGYMTNAQAQEAAAAAQGAQLQQGAPNVMMIAALALGGVVIFKMLTRSRRRR